MDGNQYGVIVLVYELDHLMHPSLVVTDTDKPAEDPHSMVYMDDIVSYIERSQVIYGQLLAFLDSTSYGHPMEPVEYLMVGIAAYPVLIVDESGVDVLSGTESRSDPAILGKYGPQSLKL